MARIAFVLGEDFEDSEFAQPYNELRHEGHEVEVLGVTAGETMHGKRGTENFTIHASVADRDPTSYDALVIPGGYSPDHLRTDKQVVHFVDAMVRADKIVAAVCHGPQLLIEADAVEDKKVTSWPSVRTDLINAGAKWTDKDVVVDGKLITSRKPDDLPAFIGAIRRQLRDQSLKKAV